MTRPRTFATEEVVAIARATNLDLSDERAQQLAENLGRFIDSFKHIRRIDTRDYDPAILIFRSGNNG